MKKVVLTLLLAFVVCWALPPANAFDERHDKQLSGEYDGVWLAESGQFFTVNENDSTLVVIQLDNKLHGSDERLFVVYIGERVQSFSTVQTFEGFADVHSTLDIHFVDPDNMVLTFSTCDSFEPECEHSPPTTVRGWRVW